MLTVLACGSAIALPVGNPSDASLLCDGLFWEGNCCMDPCDPCASWCDAFSFRFGFYGDYVFNRHMEVRNGDDGDGRRIERFALNTNAGYLALNLWNRFDVFATLGASDYSLNTNADSFVGVIVGPRAEVTTTTTFSWSVGGRATLWECGCTALGIEGQYFQFTPDIERVTIASAASVYPNNFSTKYREWQVGLGVSHRINMLVPYIAVKYARARLSNNNDRTLTLDGITLVDGLGTWRAQKHWGYAVGVSLVDCEKMSVTAEGRFADEKAFHVNAQIRF